MLGPFLYWFACLIDGRDGDVPGDGDRMLSDKVTYLGENCGN